MLETLARFEDVPTGAAFAVVALASRATRLQVMDALVLGLVRVDPELLGVENKVDGEEFLVDEFLL